MAIRGRKPKLDRNAAVVAMRSAGATLQEIGSAFGISHQRVSQLLYPVRRRARNIAFVAKKRGLIQKPVRCERCSRKRRRLEMHHPDHSSPLSVRWLCRECHGAEDTIKRADQKAAREAHP